MEVIHLSERATSRTVSLCDEDGGPKDTRQRVRQSIWRNGFSVVHLRCKALEGAGNQQFEMLQRILEDR